MSKAKNDMGLKSHCLGWLKPTLPNHFPQAIISAAAISLGVSAT